MIYQNDPFFEKRSNQKSKMMQKSWFLVGVFMGWDSGFRCVSTEKWCFSYTYITLHPLGVIHNTTGFILLNPRPTRRTFSGWKRTCRSWEVTYWVWPTSQLAKRGTWASAKGGAFGHLRPFCVGQFYSIPHHSFIRMCYVGYQHLPIKYG